MSETDELFKKLETMPLEKLLQLCSLSIEEKLDEKRLDTILYLLEVRLQRNRLAKRLGLKVAP